MGRDDLRQQLHISFHPRYRNHLANQLPAVSLETAPETGVLLQRKERLRRTALRGLQAGVLDRVNLNGGLVGFPRNASVAAAAGLRCWHGSGNDLGIRETAYIHAAAVAPNCTMASDFVGGWTRGDDLIVEPIQFADGFTPTPMKPGLGCALDEVALERFAQAYERVGTHDIARREIRY